tara:strand:+ start:444 stop:884 length:441 start_codon:yes stop_codon:yes gene_type:complete
VVLILAHWELEINLKQGIIIMKNSLELTAFLKSLTSNQKEDFTKAFIKSSGTKTSGKFEVKNPEKPATVGMINKLAMTFVDHIGNNKKPLPKGIAYGTIRGHFLNRLNNDKETLTQGKIVKIMDMKALPSSDIKAMQSYKKLVAKG